MKTSPPSPLSERPLAERFLDRLRRVPLFVGALAGVGGIGLIDLEHRVIFIAALVVLLLVVLWGFRHRRELAGLAAISLLSFLLLGWRHQERVSDIASFPFASSLLEGNPARVSGEAWVADTIDSGTRSFSTSLHLVKLQVAGRIFSCDQRVPAWIQGASVTSRGAGNGGKIKEPLQYGSRVRFSGRLVPLEGAPAPGAFDERRFHYRQSGALARLEIADGDEFTLLPGRGGSGIVRFAMGLRSRFEAALLEGVPPVHEPYARLVAAMTLGARENSPEELEEHFRVSGTLHLFAVSGMHVGVVAGLLLGCARLLGIERATTVPLVVPLVLFYAVLTGLSPSAVRAAVMFSVFLGGYGLREKPQLVNSLGFAALLLLALDSQQLFLPGFQLTFAVLFFIAVLAPRLSGSLARPFLADPFIPRGLVTRTRRFFDRFTLALAASLAVSLASWFGSAGFLAWHFQSLSPVGIIANVFMVPFAGIIISLAAGAIVAHGIGVASITLILNRVNVAVTAVLTALAQFFAGLPGAYVHTGSEGNVSPRAGVCHLDLMGGRGEGAILLTVPSAGPGKPLLWMIDSGGSQTYRAQVLPLLRSRGINRLDALVLTHGDSGHLGAAAELLDQFRPISLVEPSLENRSPFRVPIEEAAGRLEIKTQAVERGHLLRLGDATTIRVLHPSSLRPGRLADDRALVLKLTHAGRSVLFTSDSGFETESFLLESGADLRADLWVRGQNLETPGSLPAFVEAVRPGAVVSSHSDFPLSERIPDTLREWFRERGIPLLEVTEKRMVSAEIGAGGIRLLPHDRPGEAVYLPGG